MQSQDGRTRNVSTIEIEIVKGAPGAESKPESNEQKKKTAKNKD